MSTTVIAAAAQRWIRCQRLERRDGLRSMDTMPPRKGCPAGAAVAASSPARSPTAQPVMALSRSGSARVYSKKFWPSWSCGDSGTVEKDRPPSPLPETAGRVRKWIRAGQRPLPHDQPCGLGDRRSVGNDLSKYHKHALHNRGAWPRTCQRDRCPATDRSRAHTSPRRNSPLSCFC